MSTATNGSTKRPAGIIYTAIADFENGEQYGADDVWQKLLETIPGSALDNGSTANLWSMVFNDNWNSDCPTESVPPTPGRSALEPMVICGTFNQDLPESGKSRPSPHRKKGQPAYLKLHPHKGGTYDFCDSQGRQANPKHVELTGKGKYKLGDFLVRAISQYDNLELARVKTFNIKLAVYIVRRRLRHWTRDSWPTSGVSGEEELFYKFLPLELARENDRFMCRAGQDVDKNKMVERVMDERYLGIPGMRSNV